MSDLPRSFRVEPAGVQWLKPGLEKCEWTSNPIQTNKFGIIHSDVITDDLYLVSFCLSDFLDLTLDTNTVNAKIRLSDDNRLMSHVDEDQKYPSHEDRFDHWPQLLSRDGLTGRCYWEVEWNGRSHIAVTYRGINRRGNGYDCLFGRNDQSWSLVCSDTIGYSFWHDNKATYITVSAASSASDRVAVYLDWPAGTLSFYRVSSDTMIHLHTCTTKFSEPLFPGFRFWSDRPGSTIRLCSPKERFSFVKGN